MKSVVITPEHPWVSLETIQDVEAWMDLNDRELQQLVGNKHTVGHGICFSLLHGGEIYLHTNSDGDLLLDVTPEAEWSAPVISATTQVAAPRGQIWILPQHVLLQLILGLNTLVASSRLVLRHEFRLRK
ncbi:MAG: hypothetical protein V4447_04535 [Pseudomonadota bacterium]